MTAYGISPVGAHGVEREREQRIDIPSRYELLLENERLKDYLDAAREDVCTYRGMWAAAHDGRLKAEARSTRAFRVLASLGRLSPRMAALVAGARREIWRLDR